MKPHLLLLLCLTLALPLAAQTSGPTPDDVDAVFSAWGHHQAGLSIAFNTGPQGFMRLFCMWWCLPYQPTPADYTTWNFGRVKAWPDPADGSETARWPGQAAGCNVVGFARTNNVIFVRCADRSSFQPAIAPGGYRAFLAGLTPAASAKVIRP